MARDPNLRLREIAAQVGITERATQLIIGDLIADGYLTRTKIGRRNSYSVQEEAPLRHPMMNERPVATLLGAFRNGTPATSEL